ncbi:MAG: purine-nucleoside phosphorylase [Actinobacteria bacterium]|nr:purine-nucleoside phosphorylase [Actinomycetota bacterium]
MDGSQARQQPKPSRARLTEDEHRSPRDPQPGTTTLHLNPAATFHPNVLLPGDPGRAMEIATARLTEPRMFNHRRGLWGYSGISPRGTGFLVQSTGMGGPSAAIVCEELADLGARLFVRVGTCGAIDSALKLGDLMVVREAICDDGASRALDAGERVAADVELTELLVRAAGSVSNDVAVADPGRPVHVGVNATVDLFYDPYGNERYQRLRDEDALTIEMECAAVLAVAKRRSLRAACLLVVTDELWNGERRRLDHDGFERAGELLGLVGVAAVEAFADQHG